MAAVALSCSWVLAFPHLWGDHSPALSTLSATLCGLASGLLLALGVLLAGRWRLTGEHCAGAAAAAMVLGFCLPMLGITDPLLQPPGTSVHITTARLLLVLPVLLLLVIGSHARSWPVAPALVALLVFACWLAAIVALATSPDHGAWLWSSARAAVLHGVACASWLLLARRAWNGARQHDRPMQHWVAFSLTLMAVCSAAQAWASTNRHVPTEFVPLLQLTAAAVVVAAVGLELHASLRSMAGRRVAVAHSLGAVHATLSDAAQQHRERVHDARTAVVALDAAARLLTRAAGAATEDHNRIEALMSAELDRLRLQLDPDAVEPVVAFGLADVLEPVLFAHQLCGAPLRSDLGEIRAIGRPSATATVVANLLANVRAHAPGAATEVRARQVGDRVQVVVEDDGPGIPARERVQVLRSGARGAAPNPGSGLGLYTALTAMTSQGGALQIGARPRGGTRITLTLPAAAPVPSAAVGVA